MLKGSGTTRRCSAESPLTETTGLAPFPAKRNSTFSPGVSPQKETPKNVRAFEVLPLLSDIEAAHIPKKKVESEKRAIDRTSTTPDHSAARAA
jgi:hypothetical protein